MEHITHHYGNSLVVGRVIAMLALTVERLYRLRDFYRGTHTPLSAAGLVLRLWLGLNAVAANKTN